MKLNLLFIVLLLSTPFAAGARASPDEDKAPGEGEQDALRQVSLFSGGGSKAPWRGSNVTLRNALSAVTLDPSAELTYNPYFAMNWSFQPWWWFSDQVFLRLQLDVVHELTEADDTTESGEALVEDLQLVLGGSGLWTVPWLGINLSADLALAFPASKASQARTLILGIGPGLRLSRGFGVLGGLLVGYNLRVTGRLFSYTTAERETPLIPGCGGVTGSCDAYLNTGVRNPYLRLSQSADLSLRILDWLGVSLAVGHAIDWLHGVSDDQALVSYQPQEDQDQRHLTFLELTVSFQPVDLLEIGVGYSALHPQQAPDSSNYVPFFNRYSVLFVDLRLQVEPLVTRIERITQ